MTTPPPVLTHVLPVFLQPPASISISGLRIVLDERGWPRAAIAEGPAHDDQDRLALYVAAEFEEPLHLPNSKAATEWLHLAKARHDLERAGRSDLSGVPRFGSNPPDFRLGDMNGLSVELAQFTESRRRSALGLLRSVKQAILQAPSDSFKHLRNRLVFVGFEDPRGLPPRVSDDDAIRAVLDTVKATDAGPEPRSLPETLNRDGFAVSVVNSPLGVGTTACFPLPMLPRSEFAEARGFEIAASMTVTIRARDTEAELLRLTNQHDVDGNDVLLITAGAPSWSDGFALIADEIAVEPWIARTISFPRPRRLKRILLHRWSFGDVYELFPSYAALSEPEQAAAGGPHVIRVGMPPAWVWTAKCPCTTGREFRDCHGKQAVET